MICPNCNKEVIIQPVCNIAGQDQIRCPECGITYSQITLKDNTDWNSIRTQAAISAMQGILAGHYSTCISVSNDIIENSVIYRAVLIADKLIAELKKGE